MTTVQIDREVLQQAIDALTQAHHAWENWNSPSQRFLEIASNLRAALSAPPEPMSNRWRDFCAGLVDMWQDSKKPYENRDFLDGSFPQAMTELEKLLASPPTQPVGRFNLGDDGKMHPNEHGRWMFYKEHAALQPAPVKGET